MSVDINEIFDFVKKNIPLSNHLGITIKEYSKTSLCFSVSLKETKNHHNSAFGGSLSALAILNSWVLLHASLKEKNINNSLVIQNSNYSFKFPVLGDFEVRAFLPSIQECESFFKILEKKQKARILIKSEIIYDSRVCGIHEGSYVAIKDKN